MKLQKLFQDIFSEEFCISLDTCLIDLRVFKEEYLERLKDVLRNLRSKALNSIRTHKTLDLLLKKQQNTFSKLTNDHSQLLYGVTTLELDTLPHLTLQLELNLQKEPALDLSIQDLKTQIDGIKFDIRDLIQNISLVRDQIEVSRRELQNKVE